MVCRHPRVLSYGPQIGAMSESTLKSDPHSHALLSSPCRPLAPRGPVVFDPPHPVGGCCPPRCAFKIEDRSWGPGRIDFRAPDEGFGIEGTPNPKIREDTFQNSCDLVNLYVHGLPLYSSRLTSRDAHCHWVSGGPGRLSTARRNFKNDESGRPGPPGAARSRPF